MMNQKEATVGILLAVLKENGIDYELNGETPIKDVLNDKVKSEVRGLLFKSFKDKTVVYKPEFQTKVDDDAELKKYVSGLVNNWVRKNKEFNCGKPYKPENPGSRAGQGDEQIRELKKLLSKYKDDPEVYDEIMISYNNRLAEIKPEVAPIDASKIPEHLRKLVK